MVDNLSKCEVKLLNKIIPQTTESASFNVFDILEQFSRRDTIFDNGYISYDPNEAARITNFLLDKKFVKQVHPDKPNFERTVKWTDKGIQLKKRNNYYTYRLRDEIMPDTLKIFAWIIGLGGVLTLLYKIITCL